MICGHKRVNVRMIFGRGARCDCCRAAAMRKRRLVTIERRFAAIDCVRVVVCVGRMPRLFNVNVPQPCAEQTERKRGDCGEQREASKLPIACKLKKLLLHTNSFSSFLFCFNFFSIATTPHRRLSSATTIIIASA